MIYLHCDLSYIDETREVYPACSFRTTFHYHNCYQHDTGAFEVGSTKEDKEGMKTKKLSIAAQLFILGASIIVAVIVGCVAYVNMGNFLQKKCKDDAKLQ